MLVDLLIKNDKLKLQQCTEQFQHHQQLRHTFLYLSGERCKQFLGSTPGLALSFSAGMLMQLRHNAAVKTLRSLGAIQWLRQLV